jgi:stage IV sporulation protein FB
MSWSFPIGTVMGTVIRIHLTFLLLLAWIGAAHYAAGGAQAALTGVVFICLLFLCVLLHEFGHVLAARRYGVNTPDITLLPIGGVARLERIPEEPAQELVVALAGPAVNVVIAALLFLALGGLPSAAGMEVHNPGVDILQRLAVANVFLVVFNLIPAFPMDGGRVLRAILAHRMGYARGTQRAASIGQVVAVGLGLVGLLIGNPLLLFIALFVWIGAAGEAHAVQMQQVARGLRLADAMITRFETLGPDARVADAAELLIRTTQHDFPVVDGAGRLRGVLTRDDMVRAMREEGPDAPVLEAMRRDIPLLHRAVPLEEAMRRLQQEGLPVIAVSDAAGRLVGLLTLENLGEMMLLHTARPPRGSGGGGGGGLGVPVEGAAAPPSRANPWQAPPPGP